MTEVLKMSTTQLLAAFRSGDVSPVDVVKASFEAMTADETNSVITRCDVTARTAAEASADRYRKGHALPMDGIPVGLKDTIATGGVATSGADALYADWIPAENATVVDRLEDAGAIVVAKQSAYSFALGHTNTFHGVVQNPWDPDRTTGGSSSGAGAAVATRQVPISLGTDTGGSIRLPASWCGVSGLKPTYGRVPNRGVMPLAWSFDTVGPLARHVDDLALTLHHIAGYDPRDASTSRREVGGLLDDRDDVQGLRIGYPTDWFLDICDPLIVEAVEAAASRFESAGAEIVPVRFPHADLTQAVGWIAMLGEISSAHEGNLSRLSEYDEAFGEHLVNSLFVDTKDYLRALRMRTYIQKDYAEAFRSCDLILVPGSVTYAPRFDDMMCQVGDREYHWLEVAARTTYSANITGLPGLALPAGTGWNGLPLGIQLIGRPFDEATLLRVGRHFQAVTDFHELDPE